MLFAVVFTASVLWILVRVVYLYCFSPLRKFNGPLLASVTDLWKVWYMFRNPQSQPFVDTHRKYGDVVRTGPNELSFADPRAIHEIYGPKGCELKGEGYSIPTSNVNGVLHDVLFSTRNITWHDRQRKLMVPAMSMTQLKDYEPWLDSSIELLLSQLRVRFVDKPKSSMDLMQWFSYFSLDAICEMAFGERAGFLESGSDVDGSIKAITESMWGWEYLSQMPIIDKWTFKNPVYLWINRKGWFVKPPPFSTYVQRQFYQRQSHWQNKDDLDKRTTLTDTFLVAQRDHPEVPEFEPFMQAISVVGAASESTGITLSSIIYQILKHPECYRKLQAEIDAIQNTHEMPILFSIASQLTYLDAVINESMRCYWIVRMPNNRITPPEGIKICDRWIPGGVEVGVWGPVIHHNRETFGEDCDVFRPERWLENEEKTKSMKAALFSFSAGKYGCLGRNLAKLELYKLIATMLRDFELRLSDPAQTWHSERGAFAPPQNLRVLLNSRLRRNN